MKEMKIISPWTGEIVREIKTASREDYETIADKAVAAFDKFRHFSSHTRAGFCFRISDLIEKSKEDFAQIITLESGKPIKYSRAEVDRAITLFQIAGEEAKRIYGEVIPLDITPASAKLSGSALKFPIGPIAAISPFNFPLNLVAHKIAPAIASGCSIVLKPAPQTPLTALKLAEIIRRSEIPDGIVTICPMENETAELMVRDDRFKLLTFTGSDKVGWYLKSISGKKKTVLELGGNAPALVHSDADLETVIPQLVASSFASAGQVCIKTQRIFIHKSLYEQFKKEFLRQTESVQTGNPNHENTVVGPLIDSKSADRVMQRINEALQNGAQLLTGGTRTNNVITPTILLNVPSKTSVLTEEIFGPVVILSSYDNIDDAFCEMNNSRYGLQASVYSFDIRIIDNAIRSLNFGGIIINNSPSIRVDNYPYGGVKDSGTGREGIRASIQEMTETKMVVYSR